MALTRSASAPLVAHRLGICRQLIAVLTLSFSIAIMGTHLGWIGPVLKKMRETQKPFTLSPNEISWCVSIVYLSNMIFPLPIGYMMDYVGRKACMMMLIIIPLLSWVLLLFAHGSVELAIGRFLAGIWCATVTTVSPIYLAEISEPAIRGMLSTFVQFDVNVGLLYVYVIVPYVSYEFSAAISMVFPLVFMLLFWAMPESPYWLSMKDNDEEAAISLAWLRGQHVDDKRVMKEIQELSLGVHEEMQHPRNFKDLVASKGHKKALLIVEVLAAAQRWAGVSSILAFMSITLPKKEVGSLSVDVCVCVIGAIWTVVVIFSSYLVDWWGRKPLLLISTFGCFVSTGACGTWYFINDNLKIDLISNYHWIPFACLVGYSIAFSLGLGPIPTTVQGEMFTMNERALASAITAMVLAFSSFVTNQIYMPIYVSIGVYLNFWIFAVVSLGTFIFVIFIFVETKGKTLHQIQLELER